MCMARSQQLLYNGTMSDNTDFIPLKSDGCTPIHNVTESGCLEESAGHINTAAICILKAHFPQSS